MKRESDIDDHQGVTFLQSVTSAGAAPESAQYVELPLVAFPAEQSHKALAVAFRAAMMPLRDPFFTV